MLTLLSVLSNDNYLCMISVLCCNGNNIMYIINRLMVRRSTRHKRSLNENKKCHKQKLKLKDVVVNSNVRCLSLDELRNNIVVCDGGATDLDAIKDTSGILCLRVCKDDLWVADTVNGSLGLRYRVKGGDNLPVFICLPREREESINIMKDGRSLCSAMRTCALTQRQTLTRGKKSCVFTEDGNKYCCIGAQPGRAERGVQSCLYRLKWVAKKGMEFIAQGSQAFRVCI